VVSVNNSTSPDPHRDIVCSYGFFSRTTQAGLTMVKEDQIEQTLFEDQRLYGRAPLVWTIQPGPPIGRRLDCSQTPSYRQRLDVLLRKARRVDQLLCGTRAE